MVGIELREPVSALTHGFGCLLAVVGTVVLWRRARRGPGPRTSFHVFGVCLIACYGLSSRYHGAIAAEERVLELRRFDHIGIYLLIAGTYTPIACGLLEGRWRRLTLVVPWSAAAIGAGVLLVRGLLPTWASTSIYLALGWGAVLICLELVRRHPHRWIAPILYGGSFYSVGAVINLFKWPEPWPGTFGAHELFHVFVMSGSFCHYLFMLRVADRAAAPRAEEAGLADVAVVGGLAAG
jgi:hemolysin III